MNNTNDRHWMRSLAGIALAFALTSMTAADLKVHVSKRNPRVNETPGEGEEGKPWTSGGLTGEVEVDVKRDRAIYIGVENSQVLVNTKVLTITIEGEGAHDFKYGGAVCVYEWGGKNRPAKGKKTGSSESADGDPESITFTIQFPIQPEWESVKLINRGPAGTFNFTITGDSECTYSEKNGNRYSHNASYGAEGAMNDGLAITEVAIYPNSVDVDPIDPAFFDAPPETGPWFMQHSFVDPSGEPRPHGGLHWTSEGLGLVEGQPYTMEFGMLGEADDHYTIYAYDSVGLRWIRYERDLSPSVLSWQSVRNHGADLYGIDLTPADGRLVYFDEEDELPLDPYETLPAPETREGELHSIQVDFDRAPVLLDPAAITATNGSESVAINNVTMAGPTTLTFDMLTLPQPGIYEIDLTGAFADLSGSRTSLFVHTVGDVDGTGRTDADDAAAVTSRAGEAVDADNVRFDINQDGIIDDTDALIVTAADGSTALCDSELVTTTWLERFDLEDSGTDFAGVGGWKGWDDDPVFGAPNTEAESNSGHASIQIEGDADLVHELDFCGAGAWSFSAWQYIPSSFESGSGEFDGSYFLLLNTYNDGGPYDWSVQMQASSTDGMMKVFHGDGVNTIDVPYITDQWVKIQTIVDLDNDWTQIYYDDTLVTEYEWTGGVLGDGGGAFEIAAVDLFANGSSSVFYDDLQLNPVAGVNPCPEDLNGDGSIGVTDMLELLGAWGACPDGCSADLDDDGLVGVSDLLQLLGAWGDC